MIMARSGSTNARGPCFSSPARMPSLSHFNLTIVGMWAFIMWLSGCEHVLGDCAPVQVCQLLDFQRPLKTSGVAVPAAKHLKIITLSVYFSWFLTRVPWQAKTSADISDWPEMTPQSMLMPELKANKETFSSWASTVFMFPGRSWRPPIISDLIQIVGEYISTH